MNKKTVLIGISLIVLSIIFGAFGAHGLKSITEDLELIKSFETGVKYQLYSGFGLLIVGLSSALSKIKTSTFLWCVLIGTFFFSGSIYGLVLSSAFGSKLSFLGPITPIGGILMILGWSQLFFNVATHKE